ncbi:carcinoembryonic antigen-related cell adhesion molecule 21-like [Heterodontus francisci]|uniref:carcinoembryonic antigen-related cell adhesion molecule 21-like n=1 Tax=Heterodontus francisci TaxID=7792 RepID=UPI00355BAB4C
MRERRIHGPPVFLSLFSACMGFSGGVTVVEKHPPLPLSEFPDRGLQSDEVMLWEYVTTGNKTPAYRERSAANQVKFHVKNRSLLEHSEIANADAVKVNSLNQAIYIIRKVKSSVLLFGYQPKKQEVVSWTYINSKVRTGIVHYSSQVLHISPYYRHRTQFDVSTGSLLMQNLQVKDSGIYEVVLNPVATSKLEKGDEITYVELDIQEQLLPPRIVQNPEHVLTRVELSCVLKIGKANSIRWQKDYKEVLNSSHVRLEFDNSTLFIEDMDVSDCGLYICTVTNDVSTNRNSHFLTANGCPIGYKVAAALGCVQCLAMTIYIVIRFLRGTEEACFLTNKYKGNIFLGCESVIVLIAVLQVVRSKQNLQICRSSYHALFVKVILSVILYVCGLGLFILLHNKFTHKDKSRHLYLKAVKRVRESKGDDD